MQSSFSWDWVRIIYFSILYNTSILWFLSMRK
jgi:hypothetical protein